MPADSKPTDRAVENALGVIRLIRAIANEPSRRRREDDYRKHAAHLLIADLHPDGLTTDLLTSGETSARDAGHSSVLRVRDDACTAAPTPPDDIVAYTDREELGDPEAHPAFRMSAEVKNLSTEDPAKVLLDGEGNVLSTPESFEADYATLEATFNRWMTDVWQPWADREQIERRVRHNHRRLAELRQAAANDPAGHELVLAFGVLQAQAGEGIKTAQRRPIFARPISIDRDLDNGGLMVVFADDQSTSLEDRSLPVNLQQAQAARLRISEHLADFDADPSSLPLANLCAAWARMLDGPPGLCTTNSIPGLLQAVVNHLEVDTDEHPPSPLWRLDPAPLLLLRRRDARGIDNYCKALLEQPDAGTKVVAALGHLTAEVEDDGNIDDYDDRSLSGSTSEVFAAEPPLFPLPSNDEQERIARLVRRQKQVLVQGPPGTGKSHSITNLVADRLAAGDRVLITSHTADALAVIHHKLPEALRSLCVTRLDRSSADRDSLGQSLNGLIRKSEETTPRDLDREANRIAAKRQAFDRELAVIDRQLREYAEAESSEPQAAISADDRVLLAPTDRYQGRPGSFAAALAADRNQHAWILEYDPLPQPTTDVKGDIETDADISDRSELTRLPADLAYALQHLPTSDIAQRVFTYATVDTDSLPRVTEITKGLNDLANAAAESAEHRDPGFLLNQSQTDDLPTPDFLHDLASRWQSLIAQRDDLQKNHPHLAGRLLPDFIAGNTIAWNQLDDDSTPHVDALDQLDTTRPAASIDGLGARPAHAVLPDAQALHAHLAAGGRLKRFGLLAHPLLRHRGYLLDEIKVDGFAPNTTDRAAALVHSLALQAATDALVPLWAPHLERTAPLKEGSVAQRARCARAAVQAVQDVRLLSKNHAVFLRDLDDALPAATPTVPSLDRAPDDSQILAFGHRLYAAAAHRRHAVAQAYVAQLHDRVCNILITSDRPVPPAVKRLLATLNSVAHVETDAIETATAAHAEILTFATDYTAIADARRTLDQLRRFLPGLATALADALPHPADQRPRTAGVAEAYHWRTVYARLDALLQQTDPEPLEQRRRAIINQRDRLTIKLIESRAWSAALKRLTKSHRRHLTAWLQHITALGSGGGKRADHLRTAARKSLTHCRDAVPAWIMPLNLVFDSFRPGDTPFDLAIIDEASQTGIEGLLLPFLAKRLIIIGDDQQNAPDAVGTNLDDRHRLIRTHVPNMPDIELFGPRQSLFDHAKRTLAGGQIRLREHFRCMPEIIAFSNQHFYKDEPLIPLRQFSANRLPPVRTTFVPEGQTQGTSGHRTNEAEADRLVAALVNCLSDPAYHGKTFAVISLLGDAQYQLIQGKLLDELGIETYEKHRIVCGNARRLQGDERDIVFLSMVSAPNQTFQAQTKEAARRRFNVAASRARDQMWLFHSVETKDCKPGSLQRQLLEHCLAPQEADPILGSATLTELEAAEHNKQAGEPAPDPFDSWFELRVAVGLARRGFAVQPQHRVGPYRIDLVVIHQGQRIAIECDGDHWHGPDRYEEDRRRQNVLERAGWTFLRIRDGKFNLDRTAELDRLAKALRAATQHTAAPVKQTAPETQTFPLPTKAPAPSAATTPKPTKTHQKTVSQERDAKQNPSQTQKPHLFNHDTDDPASENRPVPGAAANVVTHQTTDETPQPLSVEELLNLPRLAQRLYQSLSKRFPLTWHEGWIYAHRIHPDLSRDRYREAIDRLISDRLLARTQKPGQKRRDAIISHPERVDTRPSPPANPVHRPLRPGSPHARQRVTAPLLLEVMQRLEPTAFDFHPDDHDRRATIALRQLGHYRITERYRKYLDEAIAMYERESDQKTDRDAA